MTNQAVTTSLPFKIYDKKSPSLAFPTANECRRGENSS